jgi:hypothetical protein
MVHGHEYRDLLDARDKVLEHTFNIIINCDQAEVQRAAFNFLESNIYAELIKSLKKFLIEAISNVISIAFKFLCKEELGNREAKEYASKNMMLNMQSVFRRTIEVLKQHEILQEKINIEEIQ